MKNLYVINCNDMFYKIGKTANLKHRIKQIQASCPYKISVEKVYKDGFHLEKIAHKFFKSKRIHGEWFKLTKKDIMDFDRAFEVKNGSDD